MKNMLNEEELRSVNGAGSAADRLMAEKDRNNTLVKDEDVLNEIKLPDFDLV